ncbi:peptide deformylase [Candidatus Kaiserbacteria bacterium CG10_big_fil_rev_8_21_14_0_10_59_10]|uniref:Peptide deformylase n=1 Tax=Candidatus Kaiserbacteria bacterium CG10_big_fil_rev_8_21_14_0_10_59_10 TaxID=1974612 RepID=A0A2H0U8W1_9BACT|nr:MAG: peptide deformylase [Candidatus Kaiserbacteria bacterium CG10_big_fil_rev_8_21_14_0_10_59_10]
MKRTIVQEGAAALRAAARNVPPENIGSPELTTLINDMRRLLANEEHGVALAAPQVGESLRLFIVSDKALQREAQNSPDSTKALSDDSGEPAPGKDTRPPAAARRPPATPYQVYINPVLLKLSRERSAKHEGCLSIRGVWGIVQRAEKATIRALDEHGREFTRGASGLLAHIFQHEMDHLEGILYTDKALEVFTEKEDAQRSADKGRA